MSTNNTPWLTTKSVKKLFEKLNRGESLTLDEQRALLSSHEHFRARFLVKQREVLDCRNHVEILVKASVEHRRSENDPKTRKW